MTKQITLRIEEALHERLRVVAERNRRSLAAQILVWAERGLEQDQQEQGRESNA